MRYVVKATSPDGTVDWICQPKFADIRTFGKRESAEIFATTIDAHAAILSMPSVLESIGVKFSIERLDESGGMASSSQERSRDDKHEWHSATE